MIRHLYLSAKEFCFNRSIYHGTDEGVAHTSFSLVGKATVDKDYLASLATKDRSRDCSLTLSASPKDETPEPDEKKTDHESIRDRHIAERKRGPWREMVRFVSTIGKFEYPITRLRMYLPQPVRWLAAVCRRAR